MKTKFSAKRIQALGVTREIIENSVRGDSSRCMIAGAIRQAIPEAKRIDVDLQYVRFTRNCLRHVYPLPSRVAYNLASFESGEEVEPFVFDLVGGNVYQATSPPGRKGTVSRIRLWAVDQGVMTAEDAAKKRRIPPKTREAYIQATGDNAAATVRTKPPATMSQTARQHTRHDRFYGLRLRTGFKPGGEPVN